MQNHIFDRLMDAGQEFGIKPFGIRAMTALAIEKSYRLIPRELSIEYSAWEAASTGSSIPTKAISSAAMRSCACASKGRNGPL